MRIDMPFVLWQIRTGTPRYSDFDKLLNFGWSCYEGTYRIYDKHYEDVINSLKPCKENLNNKLINFKKPSLQYFHDSLLKTNGKYGNSIIGGVLYKNKNSIWHNHYFFGDIVSSNIWYLDINNPDPRGINFISGENLDLGLTSINQIDNCIRDINNYVMSAYAYRENNYKKNKINKEKLAKKKSIQAINKIKENIRRETEEKEAIEKEIENAKKEGREVVDLKKKREEKIINERLKTNFYYALPMDE